MALFQTEFFGHFIYSPELTYEDLLEREEALKVFLQDALLEFQATAVNFEALGDSLRVQCIFAEGDEAFFREFTAKLAPAVMNGLSGKLFFVDKDLERASFFALSKGKWKEAIFRLGDGKGGKGLVAVKEG